MMMMTIALQSFINLFCSVFCQTRRVHQQRGERGKREVDRPCPHAGVRTHRLNRNRGREVEMYPADQSQVFPFPLPNPPPRYGTDQHHQWSPWRATGPQDNNPRTPRQLELSSSHQLSGYYINSNGWLLSLCIRNLDTGEQQEMGGHKPDEYCSLIVAPPFSVESKISHLSGNEAAEDWRICFHFN